MKKRIDRYQVVTDRIVGLLQKGVCPWRKPWRTDGNGNPNRPRNGKSGHRYRGINLFLLSCQGFGSPDWFTFKQAKQLGGSVRKGEKGSPIIWWSFVEKKERDETGKESIRRIPCLRGWTVFNRDQIEGLPEPKEAAPTGDGPKGSPSEKAEIIIEGMPQRPIIGHGGTRAYYQPMIDRVQMPPLAVFDSHDAYYGTLFHELGHATGHRSRLDRPEVQNVQPFGSDDYSREELVAEMTSAFLCAESGIDGSTLETSASYLQSWIDVLQGDKKALMWAAGRAQKAADFILGIK